MLKGQADEMAETHARGIGILEIASLAMMFWNLGKMLLSSWRTDDPVDDHAALSRSGSLGGPGGQSHNAQQQRRRGRRDAYTRCKRQVRRKFKKYDPSDEWVEAVTQDYLERGRRLGPDGIRAAMESDS